MADHRDDETAQGSRSDGDAGASATDPADPAEPVVPEDGDGLARALARAGIANDLGALRALIAGVAASSAADQPARWLPLLGGDPDPALTRTLTALVAAARPGPPGPVPPGERVRRLADLRRRLDAADLDGVLVPRADEHQGESVPPGAERLAWICGFTGSAGLLVVLRDQATLFIDGRYTLQAAAETDPALFDRRHLVDDPPERWLARTLPAGSRLGYDPRLHTVDWVERAQSRLARAEIALVALTDNPIDAIWNDRPPPPLGPVIAHPLRFTGRSSEDKRRTLAEALANAGTDAAILTQPDSIAWLLNIRGADVPYTPVALATAILARDGTVELFVDLRKLSPGLLTHLGPAVTVAPPDRFDHALAALGAAGRRIRLDPATTPHRLLRVLETAGAEIDRAADPCQMPKAIKTAVELDGARSAHLRDGAAIVRFLTWLERTAPGGTVTEQCAADRLRAIRATAPEFEGLSFETISGAGPNGAIVHYRVDDARNRPLAPGGFYLVDSGAQYRDGTTDITRTVAIGPPTAEMRRFYTLVLKGHIAVATSVFPAGTTGSQIDAFARRPLWKVGIDYDHGTGHGVGSYLGVHEGPQRLSRQSSEVALKPGMILSNEPGYYRPGAFGIRLENLIAVTEVAIAGAERPMLGFEVLTLAPFDRSAIAADLLDPAEIAWLDAYHTRVADALAPLLDDGHRAWLAAATRPLAPESNPAAPG